MHHLHPHRKLQIIAVCILFGWIAGTFAIHYLERAQGWTYFDALYFTVITTATIGFGDYIPHTVGGKILTMIYAIVYVPLFLYTSTILFETRLKRIHREEEEYEKILHTTEENAMHILDK
jgi:CBS domain containing-hemolysin-like protein